VEIKRYVISETIKRSLQTCFFFHSKYCCIYPNFPEVEAIRKAAYVNTKPTEK